MKKVINMERPVKDYFHSYWPLEMTIHKTSYLLTDLFLGEGKPFRKRMEKKVCRDDIESRRIRFDVGGYPYQHKDPKTGQTKWLFSVTSLWLLVCTNDHRKDDRDEMQTRYIECKLYEYMYEQGVKMPSRYPDDIEHLLNYLSQFIPCVWDYFDVVEKEESDSDSQV